jgi:hypothetical protein
LPLTLTELQTGTRALQSLWVFSSKESRSLIYEVFTATKSPTPLRAAYQKLNVSY